MAPTGQNGQNGRAQDEPVLHWIDGHLSASKGDNGQGMGVEQRPFLTLTYAQSLDGCIAHAGVGRLILSGDKSMTLTHKLRSRHDAILIGIGTLIADNPRLSTRLVEGRSPLPVILDSKLRTPLSSKVVARAAEAESGTVTLVVITTPGGDEGKATRRQALQALRGVRIIDVEATANGTVSLPQALCSLRRELDVASVMVEGGAKVIGSFLAAASELVDCVLVTVAPVLVGGLSPAAAFGEAQKAGGGSSLPGLTDVTTCRLDNDVVICGQPKPCMEVKAAPAAGERRGAPPSAGAPGAVRYSASAALPQAAPQPSSAPQALAMQEPDSLLELQNKTGTWSVTTRVVEVMVAHSFKGEQFGPAQALHGITFHLSATFAGRSFSPRGKQGENAADAAPCLMDAGQADGLLREVAARYANTNLDTLEDFQGKNSTCECFAEVVWRRLSEALAAQPRAGNIESLKIVVQEGDAAFVEYERPLSEPDASASWLVSVRDRMHVACPASTLGAAAAASSGQTSVMGRTLVVDAAFIGHELQPDATYLIDIIAAHDMLRDAVSTLDQSNLAEVPSFENNAPVQHWVAKHLWQLVAKAVGAVDASALVKALRITVAGSGSPRGAGSSYCRPLRPVPAGSVNGKASKGAVGATAAESMLQAGAQVPVTRRVAAGGLTRLCGNTLLLNASVAWRGAEASPQTLGCSIESVQSALVQAASAFGNAILEDMSELNATGAPSLELVAAGVWWRMQRMLPATARGSAKVRITVQDSDQGSVAFEDGGAPWRTSTGRIPVLLVDLDGCLMTSSAVLEQHPVRIVDYCRRRYGLDRDECDRLHHAHGSTIGGLQAKRAAAGEQMPAAEVAEYYKAVFQGVDISALQDEHGTKGASGASGESASGMHHRARLKQLLAALPCQKFLATNSPYEWYVRRVLAAMGLSNEWSGVICPDRDVDGPRSLSAPWPSKESPAFWHAVRERFPSESYELILLDDSERNLWRAEESGIRGVAVTKERPLEHALLEVLGCVASASPASAVDYLLAKEAVDRRAISDSVLDSLGQALTRRRADAARCLRVLDIGAGLIPLMGTVAKLAKGAGYSCVDYLALERSPELAQQALRKLAAGSSNGASVALAGGAVMDIRREGVQLRVAVLERDLRDTSSSDLGRHWAGEGGDHLAVACGFADLLPPDELSCICHRLLPGALCWLPITFAGRTWFEPPCAAGCASGAGAGATAAPGGRVPSDGVVAHAYHRHLEENEGQHLDVSRLVSAFRARGAKELASGSSDWAIDPTRDSAMWEAMARFLGLGAPAFLWPQWCFASWLCRLREVRPVIRVANVDILFELGDSRSCWQLPSFTALSFVAPRKVEVQRRSRQQEPLAAGQVELRSLRSLISSGTEMKFYRGDFGGSGETEALDSKISGLGGAMAYPMDYGYSLCGRVVAAGPAVDSRWVGKMAFLFHPHASAAVAEASSLQEVPEGISASDAVFLPAVETALAIVHDAQPRAGERVLVVGQGLIGLLVTALLARMWVEVEACDLHPERLALSQHFGAGTVWLASESRPAARYDVAIEVSGHHGGLQAAIDQTRSGGRVVIASWYSSSMDLRLGTRFHRSHIRLIASQVSDIPAEVAATWTKERRFHAAWRLLRELRPSERLTSMRVPLARAAEAYESLEGAPQTVVAAEIVYDEAEHHRTDTSTDVGRPTKRHRTSVGA